MPLIEQQLMGTGCNKAKFQLNIRKRDFHCGGSEALEQAAVVGGVQYSTVPGLEQIDTW